MLIKTNMKQLKEIVINYNGSRKINGVWESIDLKNWYYVNLLLKDNQTEYEYAELLNSNNTSVVAYFVTNQSIEDIKKSLELLEWGNNTLEQLKIELEKIFKWPGVFLRDIPKITNAEYKINVFWKDLKNWFTGIEKDVWLELNPEYQRWYVWSEEQKIKYIEYMLKWGRSAKEVYFNCPGWNNGTYKWPLELVDWKQRISAILDFLDSKIPAFWHYYNEYRDKVSNDMIFYINDLENPVDVVNWYLDMNTGWSIHTEKDLKTAYDYKQKVS